MLEVRGLRLEEESRGQRAESIGRKFRILSFLFAPCSMLYASSRALLQPDTEPAPCGLHSHAGFTLLEVLVAVAILAIAMVAILKANVQSLETLTKSRETSTASLLATSKLAEIEAVGVESWSELRGDFAEDYPDYTFEVETSSTEVEGLVRVVVTVQRGETASDSEVRIEELLYAQ
jgi:general secretion pathway protein I